MQAAHGGGFFLQGLRCGARRPLATVVWQRTLACRDLPHGEGFVPRGHGAAHQGFADRVAAWQDMHLSKNPYRKMPFDITKCVSRSEGASE